MTSKATVQIAATEAAAGAPAGSNDTGRAGEVEVAGVSKRFGAFTAVDHVSYTVASGEFFSMLGPSGCGKTTTLRMIAGFEQPTIGHIRLGGANVSKVPPHRRRVNTVFQQYALFPHLTILDNVAFGPRSQGTAKTEARRRAGEMLEVVQLSHLAKRKPAQLSGGQQQRVALARALVNHPEALLLDEPLGALDLKLRQAMQIELKRIQREVGITFIYVTHDQEEALTMSDRVAVMNEGRVEQIGDPVAIYDDPSTVFVAGFIGQANLWEARVRGVSSTGLELDTGAAVVPAPGRSGVAGGDAVALMVRPERVRVTSQQPPAPAISLPATVTNLVFLGHAVKLQLLAADGEEIVAHVGHDAELPLLHPGEEVWASWDLEASRVLPSAPDVTAAVSNPLADELELEPAANLAAPHRTQHDPSTRQEHP